MATSTSSDADVHASERKQSTSQPSSQLEGTPDVAEDSPSDDGSDELPTKPAAPMQKRRRVTRACDECRRKKIKCDGKQPCVHCTVYSYECTYDQPSNRRRTAAPQYIEALETQLKRAKAILGLVLPTLDLNDPSIDVHLQRGVLPQFPTGPRPLQLPNQPHPEPEGPRREDAHDSHLESMVRATGQLDLDEDGYWDYHGHSSGLIFMRGIQQKYGDILTGPPPSSAPFVVRYRPMSQTLDSPSSPADSASVHPAGTDLPNKKKARMLCDNAILEAGVVLRVVHLPSFYKSLDRIYEVPTEEYGTAENTFLPLLYAVLALGTLFSKSNGDLDQSGYEPNIEEGYKYFRASRSLLDITDCRDLTTLQAIVFMIQFLQSSAKLSTCYAYIGVALRSAIRMGLHRSFNVNFTPIEAETRKRLFWVIRRMDIYVSAMLGLPHFLEDEDVDQDYPTEVDDEYITETEIRPMPEGKVSITAASNAHARIVQVLLKICRYIYPTKATQSGGKNTVSYTVSYSKVREIEQDMQQWLDTLPMALKPGGEAPHTMIKAQQMLRMAYGHAQLLLYRPFLHYVSQSYRNKPSIDQRAFACASACISVSRNIIHITAEMKRRGLLIGSYWFSMYTTFFAIVSVLYFVLENPENQTSQELLRDAIEGKELLSYFAKRSLAADKCAETIGAILEKLPEKIKQNPSSGESKKRRQGSTLSLQTRPDTLRQESLGDIGPRRATFPEGMPTAKRTSLPLSQTHLNNLGIDPAFNSPSQTGTGFFDAVPALTAASTTARGLGAYGFPGHHVPAFPPTPLSLQSPSMNAISDMSTMMFPSADPMAYPNQPMTTFEDAHPQTFGLKQEPTSAPQVPFSVSGIDNMQPTPPAFSPGSMTLPLGLKRSDTEVQLFGPMPMYLMQEAQQRGLQQQHGSPNTRLPGQETSGVNLDDLFGGDQWAQSFMDPGLGLNSSSAGFGNAGHYPTAGPGMGNW